MKESFRGPEVCRLVGISYRQLDYWARTHLVRPTVQDARGSGSQRVYSFADLVALKVVSLLLQDGRQGVLHAMRVLRDTEVTNRGWLLLINDSVELVYDAAKIMSAVAVFPSVMVVSIEAIVAELVWRIEERELQMA